MNNSLRLLTALGLLACAGLAQAKCVPVRICDDSGKNCHQENMCSVYSKIPESEQTKTIAAPEAQTSGKPVSLLPPEPACDDKPVPGQPRKVCK